MVNTTYVICDAEVNHSRLGDIVEQIVSMGVCQLGVLQADLGQNEFNHFHEVSRTSRTFGEDGGASRNDTK